MQLPEATVLNSMAQIWQGTGIHSGQLCSNHCSLQHLPAAVGCCELTVSRTADTMFFLTGKLGQLPVSVRCLFELCWELFWRNTVS